MPAPPFRAAGPGDNFTTASPVVTAPAGMVAGDYVVCWFGTDTVHTRTVPVGWTDLGLTDDAGADTSCSAIGKLADAADVAAGSWTFTNYFVSAESGRAGSLCYSGVDQTNPVNAGPAVAAASTFATKTSPSVTTTVADCTAVFLIGADPGANPRTCTATAPAVARLTSQNALLGWIYAQDSEVASAGAFTQVATLNAADGTGNIAFALAGASAGAPAPRLLGTLGVGT